MADETPTLPAPALAKLRASESRYRRLFEAARDGILLLNAETGQIEDVNPYLIELLGYSHDEFLGKKLWEVGAFADIEECRKLFAIIQQTGYARYETLPLLSSAGRKVPVEFVSNSYECDGVIVVECNVRDNTAHQEMVRQYKAVINSSNDAIIGKSLLGVIETWNLGAEKLFGYSAAEAIGRSIAFLVPLERLDQEWAILARLSHGEQIDHFETTRQHKDGSLIDISMSLSPIRDSRGQIIGASSIAMDLPARNRGEVQAYARATTQSHQAGLNDDLAARPLDQTERGLVEHAKAGLEAALEAVSAENRDFLATHQRLTEKLAALEQILNDMSVEIDNQAQSLSKFADNSCIAATAAAAAFTADVWDPVELRRKSDIAVTATNATKRVAGDLTDYLHYMKGTLAARAALAGK